MSEYWGVTFFLFSLSGHPVRVVFSFMVVSRIDALRFCWVVPALELAPAPWGVVMAADGGGTPGAVFSVFCVWLQYGGTGLGAVGHCGFVFG